MISGCELSANALNALSIYLAGRNHVQTWWTGILGCGLFAWLFFDAKLYADVTLQLFFIGTSAVGWWQWSRREQGRERPIRHTTRARLAVYLAAALLAAGLYGWLLHCFTDAYAPFVDSAVLSFSVLAQLLLMDRRLETWGFWVLVNVLSVPLYAVRGLYLTAALYALFLINAALAGRHWRRLAQPA